MLASFGLLLFALVRPDMDDVNPYTGYSVMLNQLGLRSSRYVENENIFFYIATLVLLMTLSLDIYLFVKSKRPPVIPVNQELV